MVFSRGITAFLSTTLESLIPDQVLYLHQLTPVARSMLLGNNFPSNVLQGLVNIYPDCQGRKEGIAAKGEVKSFDTVPDGGLVIKVNPGRTYYFSRQERGGKWLPLRKQPTWSFRYGQDQRPGTDELCLQYVNCRAAKLELYDKRRILEKMVQLTPGGSAPPTAPARRVPLIAGNWKMNMTVDESLALIDEMLEDLDAYETVETVICPPFIALFPALKLVEGTRIKLGAQNMYYKDSGAYTGEISPLMLREVCDYVILGHSERRLYFNETDEDINLKVKAALKYDLDPIIAVGENLDQREDNLTKEIINLQVEIALKDVNSFDASSVVIAYEPLWAIGTGRAASAETSNVVCKFIRQTVARLYDQSVADRVRIQYGGSVNPDNISDFMCMSDIDGALVGGASLKAADFVKIVARTQECIVKKRSNNTLFAN